MYTSRITGFVTDRVGLDLNTVYTSVIANSEKQSWDRGKRKYTHLNCELFKFQGVVILFIRGNFIYSVRPVAWCKQDFVIHVNGEYLYLHSK